jgi:hypothetical protein
MYSWRKALGYGVIVWLVPFVVALACYKLRQNDRILFESIMPIAVVAATVVCAVLYMSAVPQRQGREGLFLGLIWLALCIAIDQIFFSAGPMQMSFVDYLKDIGLTYVMIPFITTGHGIMQQRAGQG